MSRKVFLVFAQIFIVLVVICLIEGRDGSRQIRVVPFEFFSPVLESLVFFTLCFGHA